MSIIRALALDLYRAQQAVDKLQKALAAAAPAEKDNLARELRAAQKELEVLRKMLEGKKDTESTPRKFPGFGGFRR